ncbi:MAG: hypothetical protein AB7L66_10170, partial [Gemmatimonadales bacterium]
GIHWVALRNNMPNVPINDLALQRDQNDLVLGTHGRGIWILDQISSLQELDAAVMASPVHVFSIRPAEMTRYAGTGAHTGDMYFRGENPPNGAIIDFWAGAGVPAGSSISVRDARGNQVFRAALEAEAGSGVRRFIWNLRLNGLAATRSGDDDEDRPRGGLPGRYVAPGSYLARIDLGGRTAERRFTVAEDPRVGLTAADRAAWHRALDQIAALHRSASAVADSAAAEANAAGAPAARRERADTARELVARIGSLYGAVLRASSPPTADQRAQMAYFPTVLAELRRRR